VSRRFPLSLSLSLWASIANAQTKQVAHISEWQGTWNSQAVISGTTPPDFNDDGTPPGALARSIGNLNTLELDVFARGETTGTNYYTNGWTWSGGWSGWSAPSSTGSYYSPPDAASWGDSNMNFFGIGNNNGSDVVWISTYSSGSWTGPSSIGAPSGTNFVTTVSPTAVSTTYNSSSTLDMVAVAQDNKLYWNHYNGSGWGTWSSIGLALVRAWLR